MSGAPPCLVYTKYTRRSNDDRRVVIQGFDLPYKGFIVFLIGVVPAILAALVAWMLPLPFIGSAGVYGAAVAFVAVEAVVFYAGLTKARSGVSMFRSVTDRRSAQIGQWFVGLAPIEVPPVFEVETCRVRSVVVDLEGRREQAIDAFSG